MAGVSEFRNEQFIKEYEHITKLQLLTDEELNQVKRKRSFFEVSIKNSSEVKNYINYIKYEIALMNKFKQMDYQTGNDGRALDRVMATHVKDLFRLTLKKFQEKRKIWEHYLSFIKQKFPNIVTGVYREMLRFHHQKDDFIEAAEHEMSRNNFVIAMDLLKQGMGNHKESCEKLVIAYIECSFKQGARKDEDVKETTLVQAAKFYEKFLKNCEDIVVHCELLEKIQSLEYSMPFQNEVLTHLMKTFTSRAEVWEILATRHLAGIIYEAPEEDKKPEEQKKLPFDICLRYAIEIYEKSLDAADDKDREKMFSFFINKLLEIDATKATNVVCLRAVRQALAKTLVRGYNDEKLSVDHFLMFLKLRMIDMDKNEKDIKKMLEKGSQLYPNSMEFYEIAIKFYLENKSYDKVSETFQHAIENNAKKAIELYQFLCGVYLTKTGDKTKAQLVMLEAINSRDKQLSEAFQPYYIEFCALTDSIEKAREAYNQLLKTKTMGSLSIDFFKTMIKLEEAANPVNEKLITNCYERAAEHFGRENSEVSLRTFACRKFFIKDFSLDLAGLHQELMEAGEILGS